MKKLLKFNKLSAFIAVSLLSSSVFAADLGVANNFSAFVFEDFRSHFGRADGAIAAGNITLSGYSVGFSRPSNPNEFYLISEADISFKLGRQYVGSMLAGGRTNVTRGVRNGMEPGSGVLAYQDVAAMPFRFDEQEQHYKDLSANLSQLAATGNAQWRWGGLYLQGDGNALTQVFNIDARQFMLAHTFEVSGIPNDATVIFNITGDARLVVKGKSFASLRQHATKTVFNFADAQKLNINGNHWEGVILAPNAEVLAMHGVAKMPVIGRSFFGSMTLLGGEFTGDLPEQVEPIAPFELVQRCNWSSSDFMPEYNQVMSTPIVVQLNDDNGDGVIDHNDVADIVVVTFKNGTFNNGVVRALSGVDCSELWDYSQGAIMADASYSLAAADFDGDGIVEIVASSRFEDYVAIIDHNGFVKKQIAKASTGWETVSDIAIADINNDGTLEFVLGGAVYNYNTGFLFNINWSPTAILFDANNDGKQEVLSAGKLWDQNGVLLWSYSGADTALFSSIADIDNNGQPDIIVSIPSRPSTPEQSRLAALDHHGNLKWEVNTSFAPGGGAQAISTFLGKNDLGIVHAGYSAVTMFDKDGQVVWSIPNDDEWSGKLGVSAFDFNGDGIDEVIVQDNFKVRVLNGLNGEVLSTVANSTASLFEYPIVVDLAGDNNAELIVVSNNFDRRYAINNGVTVYGAADGSKPWKNATRIWNQHSFHQTNVNQNGSVPVVESPSWLFNNTYRSSTLK